MNYNAQIPRFSYNLAIEFECNTVGWISIGDSDDEDKKDLDFGYALLKEYQGNITLSI